MLAVGLTVGLKNNEDRMNQSKADTASDVSVAKKNQNDKDHNDDDASSDSCDEVDSLCNNQSVDAGVDKNKKEEMDTSKNNYSVQAVKNNDIKDSSSDKYK